MVDSQLIQSLSDASPEFVSVTSPEAYTAFRDGKVLFDVNQNAELLSKFKTENQSEFGSAFDLGKDGKFKSID